MPEFSVNFANPRTIMKQLEPAVLSIAEHGQRQILMNFGQPRTLTEWLGRFRRLQQQARTASSSADRSPNPSPPRRDYNFRDLLLHGYHFKKIKNTTASRRKVWCSRDLDKVLWGRSDGDHEIRGFVRIGSIDDIDVDLSMAGHYRLFIIGATRTLILEANEKQAVIAWQMALNWLAEYHQQDLIRRELRLQNPSERDQLREQRQFCEDLLTSGDIFKKYRHGTAVERKIACTADMLNLQWKDVSKHAIKGQILMADIAFVEARPDTKTRFEIVAKRKVLELEAVDQETRGII